MATGCCPVCTCTATVLLARSSSHAGMAIAFLCNGVSSATPLDVACSAGPVLVASFANQFQPCARASCPAAWNLRPC
eukprot:3618058-Amphidinium_carterae.1